MAILSGKRHGKLNQETTRPEIRKINKRPKGSSHNSSESVNENKTVKNEPLPIMKLRAIDFIDEAKPKSSEESQSGKVQKDGKQKDDPPQIAVEFASQAHPSPKRHQGISGSIIATILGLTLSAGIGWLLYTNPWLLESETKVTAQPDTSISTSMNERITPSATGVAPAAAPAETQPDAGPASPQLHNQSKTVSSVNADQSVAGTVGQPIALKINLPVNLPQTEMSVMIQSVPDKVQLSAGKNLGSGNWLLSEAELQGLTLITKASFTPAIFELDVLLVRSDGKVPEMYKLPVAIQPAGKVTATTDSSGPPSSATTFIQTGVTVAVPVAPSQAAATAAPAPVPTVRGTSVTKSPRVPVITQQEVRTILARAKSLLEHNNTASARLLLEYAAQRGSKQAMLKMGETYDPKHLSRLGVRGVQPDQEQAALWYDRAAKANAAQ